MFCDNRLNPLLDSMGITFLAVIKYSPTKKTAWMWLANQDNQPIGKSQVYNDRQLLQPYSLQQERKTIRSSQRKSMHPLYCCHSSCWRHQFDTSLFRPEMWRAHRPLILHRVWQTRHDPACSHTVRHCGPLVQLSVPNSTCCPLSNCRRKRDTGEIIKNWCHPEVREDGLPGLAY